MERHRKSVERITKRALRKCKRFLLDELVAYCTPAEHLCLCWHFNLKPSEYDKVLVAKGISGNVTRYFEVPKKVALLFEQSKYFTEKSLVRLRIDQEITATLLSAMILTPTK